MAVSLVECPVVSAYIAALVSVLSIGQGAVTCQAWPTWRPVESEVKTAGPRHNRQVVEGCGPNVVKRRSQLPDAYPERKCEDAGKLSGATWVAMVQALW